MLSQQGPHEFAQRAGQLVASHGYQYEARVSNNTRAEYSDGPLREELRLPSGQGREQPFYPVLTGEGGGVRFVDLGRLRCIPSTWFRVLFAQGINADAGDSGH